MHYIITLIIVFARGSGSFLTIRVDSLRNCTKTYSSKPSPGQKFTQLPGKIRLDTLSVRFDKEPQFSFIYPYVV